MNYTKPEVSILGDATKVIELLGSGKNSTPSDGQIGSTKVNNPAYDLDE